MTFLYSTASFRFTYIEDAGSVEYAPDRNNLSPILIDLGSLSVSVRDKDPFESHPDCFGYPLVYMRYGTAFAGKADLADGNNIIGHRNVPERR